MGVEEIKGGGVKFVHVHLLGYKKNKTLELFMISPYQKLLPEGKRGENRMEEQQL